MNERIETIISAKVGSFRGAKGLFAKSIGCDSRMLGQWLKGTHEPSEIYIQAIVRNHLVDYNWLLSGAGSMDGSDSVQAN